MNWMVAGALALLAGLAPLPLYLLALACFGLPHVLWELAWVRKAVGLRLPRWWWMILCVILALQGVGRLAVWQGWIKGNLAVPLDLLTLALALWLVFTLPLPRSGWRPWLARSVALAGGALLCISVTIGSPELAMALLVGLSVAHNFTPLGLARLGGASARGMGWLFLMPLLMLALPWKPVAAIAAPVAFLQPADAAWLEHHLPWQFAGLFPALVLAQCLHYYAVLRILPRSFGNQWRPGYWLWVAIAVSLGLTMGFLWDFPAARRLYGIAAGMHAWLEWPVLLCLLGGVAAKGERQEEAT